MKGTRLPRKGNPRERPPAYGTSSPNSATRIPRWAMQAVRTSSSRNARRFYGGWFDAARRRDAATSNDRRSLASSAAANDHAARIAGAPSGRTRCGLRHGADARREAQHAEAALERRDVSLDARAVTHDGFARVEFAEREAEERLHIGVEDEIGVVGGADVRLELTVDDSRRERVDAPLRVELVVLFRGAERASAPPRERVHRLVQPLAVLRQLVDGDRRRGRQLPLLDHARALQVSQPRGKDVGADPGEAVGEIRVPLRAVEQLTDNQKRPALADQRESVSDRTVLVESLHCCGS